MRAFLVAGSEDGRLVLDVRFDGLRDPDGGVPVDLTMFVDAAHEMIREQYPSFAYDFAKATGLLDIPGWSGAVAAYWLIPFSERSPLRTPMIEDLYRLSLLDAVVQKYRPAELRVVTEDEKLAQVVSRLAAGHGVAVSRAAPEGTGGPMASAMTRMQRQARRLVLGGLRVVAARLRLLSEEWRAWHGLRGQGDDVIGDRVGRGRLVAFYTRYPVLWERTEARTRERNFGTFPDHLARKGFAVVFPAVLSARERTGRRNLAAIRTEARELGVVFLESLLSAWELFRVYADMTPTLRYLAWRWRCRRSPIRFSGLDVRELVFRELDPEFLYGSELLTNYARAHAFKRFCRLYRPAAVFHPFEYQPMERALWAGVRAAGHGTAIVGTQSGMFTSNWLPWISAAGEVPAPDAIPQPHQSRIPDYVVAYGTLSSAALARQCHAERVLLPGAIRYPEIQRGAHGVRPLELPDAPCILVACSASRDETSLLLRAAAALASARPEMFLVLKFHFHNPMDAEWTRLAKSLGISRYRIYDFDLASLLRGSRAALLGSSSVVVEAIALECMPVVIQRPDRYNYSPALDIREAVFLCYDAPAAVEALGHCIDQDSEYWERRRAWPDALDKMVYRLDGRQDERLLALLEERRVL